MPDSQMPNTPEPKSPSPSSTAASFVQGDRIVILQSCDVHYAQFLGLTSSSNSMYAKRYGYAYQRTIGNLSPIPHTGNFNRYYLLRHEIHRGEYDWALWLDADAIVIDHAISLSSLIERTPDRLLIACRGSFRGEYDINNGVFLLNLRHPLAGEMVQAVIQRCESFDPGNSAFHSDQEILHDWLRTWQDEDGRIDFLQNHSGDDYHLFNYDGPFIRHILRDFGTTAERMKELERLADQVPRRPCSPT
jgi:hypothetical protein